MSAPAGVVAAMPVRARKMGIWTATALVVGNIVGAAIFMQPAALAPYGWNAVTAWIISLTGALCLAWVFAKLAARFPTAGGAHAFMEMGVGKDLAFLGSWGYLVSIWAANAAICITGTSYLTRLIPALRELPGAEPAASLTLLITLTWANTRAMGGRVQLVSSVIKLLPFTAVIALAAWTLFDQGLASVTPVTAVPVTPAATLAAIGITFYAMLGLESAAVPADAVDRPEVTVPRATMIGTTLSGIVTIFSTCAVALMLPLDVVANSKAPVADFIGGFMGNGASLFVAFCAVVSCYGCLNGWILIGGEMPAAMAARGALPPWFGARNAFGVPSRALVLGACITGVLLLLASSRAGVAAFNFAALIATATNLVLYLFCALAAIRFMRDGRLARTPGLVLCAGGAVIFALYAFYGSGWEPLAYGAALIAAGWPLHRLSQRVAKGALLRATRDDAMP
jgi:APA family basic amino acid/polyamine antiporter